jgi:hypothetical protein
MQWIRHDSRRKKFLQDYRTRDHGALSQNIWIFYGTGTIPAVKMKNVISLVITYYLRFE